MDDRAQKVNVELVKIQKEINEAAESARTIIGRMADELKRSYNGRIGIKNVTDFEITVSIFGNDVLIKAEVPLFQTTFIGRITCHLSQENKDDPWIKLDAGLNYDKLTNVNDQFDGYEAATILMKSILDELRAKAVLVKFPKA